MKKGKHSRKRRIFMRSSKARRVYADALIITVLFELWYLFIAFVAGGNGVTVAETSLIAFVPMWLAVTVITAIDYTGREIEREREIAMRRNARR